MSDITESFDLDFGSELAKAIVAAQSDLKNPSKNKTGQAGNQKTKYADLPSIIEQVRPILASHGLAVLQPPGKTADGKVEVATILLHTSGQRIVAVSSISATRMDPQQIGSAISYARRYALLGLLNMSADEDDDGHSATVATRAAGRPSQGNTEASASKGSGPTPSGPDPSARLIEKFGNQGKALAEVRRVAKDAGMEQPTQLVKVSDELLAIVLMDDAVASVVEEDGSES